MLVAYVKIPSIVVTLGMLSILKGRADQRHRRRLDQQPAAGLHADAQFRLFGIPSRSISMVSLTILGGVLDAL